MDETRQRILDFLGSEAERPLSFKELTMALEVPKEERNRFKKRLKQLVDDGLVIKIRGGRYGVASKMRLVNGSLICHPDGYGFVRPEEGEGAGDRSGDIYIPPRRLDGAMHGDRVVVRVEPPKRGGRKGKKEGRVIRILKRANETVVGRYAKEKDFGVVSPAEERIIHDIIIPPGEKKGAMDGMMVLVEVTRWPSKGVSPAGRVIELLGDPEDPDVEALVILKKYGLPDRFPAIVTGEVKDVPSEVSEKETRGRTDLRDKTTVTIDGETAKDFDDAVSIERSGDGYVLRVSIADVSHYVREGSALDQEAFARGTSVYFPDRCIPMLPEELSNGICSLNPHVDRLTLTAEMKFDSRGRMTGSKFYESVIRSTERMTYTNVKRLLDETDPELGAKYSHVLDDLRTMRELAEKLIERRGEQGSIDFDLPEPQLILDLEGRIEDIIRSERNIAHRLIEEFMLSANKAVAREFSKRDLPFIYRVHEEPDPESIDDFREFAAGFGLHFRKSGGPKAFQKILQAVDGKPEERLINHVLLRSMKQAVYSNENLGHFGLAFDDYTHFTSPIRRYPDLIVHRLLRKHLSGAYSKKEQDRMEAVLPEIAAQSSTRERTAMEAEREIVDLKKAQFMMDKVGEVYEGIISGVTSFGLFVELKGYFVEGLVHVSTLLDDYYIYEEKKHTLTGEHTKRTFRLADEVTVKVGSVDIERRRIDLVLEELTPERKRKAPGGKKKGGGGKGRGKSGEKGGNRPGGKKGEKKSGDRKKGGRKKSGRGRSGKKG